MQPSVDSTIATLRRVVSAASDSELARKLGVDKSTVSGWRARGRVPARFLKMVDSPEKGILPDLGRTSGELQERALPIAHVRFILLRADVVRSADTDRAMATMRDTKPFWLILHRALHELLSKVEALNIDLETAQALLLQADLTDPDATARRVEAQVAEDLADNPSLKEWK